MNLLKGLSIKLLVCTIAMIGGTAYGQSGRQSPGASRSSAYKPADNNSTEYVYERTKQSKLSSEVRRHFGGMKYGGVSYLSSSRSKYKAVKGKGIVRNRAGRSLNYRFLVLTDSKGDIGGFYLGAENFASTFTVAMTHGQANGRLARCKRTLDSRSGGYQRCVNQLVVDILTDCLLSGSSDCASNCWFNTDICNE